MTARQTIARATTAVGIAIVVVGGNSVTSFAFGSAHVNAAAPTAAGYAQQLVNSAPVADQSTPAGRSPDPSLDRPTEDYFYYPHRTRNIIRPLWWTVDQPEQATFDQIAARPPAGTRQVASGDDSESDHSTVQFVVYQPDNLPPTVGYALLEMDVVALNDSQSAVGAFAIVVPQTKRPKREDVPVTTSLRRVRIVERDDGRVVRHRMETGKRAQSLARAFDKLPVVPTGRPAVACPVPPRQATTVRFVATHHRWVAAPPVCGFIVVTRDGHELPALTPSNHYVNLVTKDVTSKRA